MNGSVAAQPYLWWQTGLIYQVYPRSFQDSNGDGIGDLEGIRQRLDYLKWLGINALWISPIYPSPMADFGYDISDYTGIHPLFGSMDDFNRLLEETHRQGLKLILDLVPNHTSHQHPWFLESRSSRDNPKRDWYLWQDAKPDGSPPNNWLSVFGGSAWEWDPQTQQYYYHAYLKEQPDLNWRNPRVQETMLNVMRFWLDKGVDGFRVDVMWHMMKDDQWRDNPPNPDYKPSMSPYKQLKPTYSVDQPEVHQVVAKMRQVMDQYHERVIIGEIYLPIQQLVTYYGMGRPGAHLPFNFQLISLPWNARDIALAIDQYEGALPSDGWPNWVLGNHDKSRIASRVGQAQARVAAMLLLTLRGTPTLYYADELGLQDVLIPPRLVQDPWEKNEPGLGLGRDPVRTPMQWDASNNAGFSDAEPWLPLSHDHPKKNVAAQQEDEQSILMLYKKLISLRQAEPALHAGSYRPLHAEGDLLAYLRLTESKTFLVVLNLGHAPALFKPADMEPKGELLISTHPLPNDKLVNGTLKLRGDEGMVIRLD
jgi:alpha-glucosidase